jgi:hypothetical protein
VVEQVTMQALDPLKACISLSRTHRRLGLVSTRRGPEAPKASSASSSNQNTDSSVWRRGLELKQALSGVTEELKPVILGSDVEAIRGRLNKLGGSPGSVRI